VKEINLIGGFYASKSVPWSAQDVVNWVPVPAKSAMTRSPIKLRGLPGLAPLTSSVVDGLSIIGNAPDTIVGSVYSFSYTATGGTPPYSWSLVSGTMPDGLVIAPPAISGTSTTVQVREFSVRVSDSIGLQSTKPDSIAVRAVGGTWIAFGRPADPLLSAYSISTSDPFSWASSKRTMPNTLAPNAAYISGYGAGALFVSTRLESVQKSIDMGLTWTDTLLPTTAASQQKIDVRGSNVILSAPSDVLYSTIGGTTYLVGTGRGMSERHLYGVSSLVGAERSGSDISISTDNGANVGFISGFPTWGSSRSAVNLLAGTTHLIMAGAANAPNNRFSRVSINAPTLSHSPFTVSAYPSTATWVLVAPSIAYGNGVFVMINDAGVIAYSSDEGISWQISSFTFPDPRSITFGDGVFVIVGLAGAIRSSTDGNVWTLRGSGTFGSDNITNIIFIP